MIYLLNCPNPKYNLKHNYHSNNNCNSNKIATFLLTMNVKNNRILMDNWPYRKLRPRIANYWKKNSNKTKNK